MPWKFKREGLLDEYRWWMTDDRGGKLISEENTIVMCVCRNYWKSWKVFHSLNLEFGEIILGNIKRRENALREAVNCMKILRTVGIRVCLNFSSLDDNNVTIIRFVFHFIKIVVRIGYGQKMMNLIQTDFPAPAFNRVQSTYSVFWCTK